MMAHADNCFGIDGVLGELIVETPMSDDAIQRPYAITNGKLYAPIAYCPFCGQSLQPHRNGLLEW